MNFQPQRILVIEGKEALTKLSECTPYVLGAPVVLLICYDKTVSWKSREGREIGDVDASIVTTQMMYAAYELGLGTLWIGGYDSVKLKESFAIPDFLVPVAMLDIGYPVEGIKPHPVLHYQRYALEETVYHNTFEGIEAGKPGRQRPDGDHEC